jgi:hypothetical protein
MEATLNFLPTGIHWNNRGVSFKFGDEGGGSKFEFRIMRKLRATVLKQGTTETYRIIEHNHNNWEYDGESHQWDTQYPTVEKPNKAFSIDAPGFNPDHVKQRAYRTDFHEIAEWHNDLEWSIISSMDGALWYANETAVLPDGREGGTNNHGSGTASNVPNTKPVADAGYDQNVGTGALVTLDGSGSSDADNDTFTYSWRQISGPSVALSDPTAQKPTFTAPGSACTLRFGLKVSDITKDLYFHNPGTYESTEDTVKVKVK